MTENERKAIDTLQDMITEGQSNGDVIIARDDEEELKTAIQALEEIQQYRAIGTIEEFKALKEKSVAKKAKKSGVTDSNGVFHEIDGIDGVPYDFCPNCEINLCTDGMFGGNRSGIKFCKNCGQAIDWSE